MKFRLVLLLFICSFQVISQEKNTLETVLQKGHAKQITCSDFHPSGEYVATGGIDRSIILWEVKSGKIIRYYNHHSGRIKSIDFSSNGSFILTTAKDNTAKIVSVLTGNVIHAIDGPEQGIRNAYFSENDSLFYILNDANFYSVYLTSSGKKITEYGKSYSAIYLNNVIRGDQILSTPNYKGAVLSNLKTGDTVLTFPFQKTYDMAISPDGSKVAFSSSTLLTTIYDATTGKEIANLQDTDAKCSGCNTSITWSHDSKILATMSNKVGATLWNSSNGKKIKSLNQFRKSPLQLRFSPNDEFLSIAFNDKLQIYNVNSGRELANIDNKYLGYHEVKFSPNSQYIILPGDNNVGDLYQIGSGRVTQKFSGYLSQKSFSGLNYSYDNWTDGFVLKTISLRRDFSLTPNNKEVVISNIDSIAMRIDLNSGKILQKYIGHSQVVIATAISPDGKTLATAGGDRKIILWNIQSGEIIDQLFGHRDLVYDLEFSSDGRFITSGSYDATIGKWDLKTGTYHLKNQENSPYTTVFSPNDLYIVSGDNLKHVKFLEADAMEEFRQHIGHNDVVQDIVFSKNGELMATASWDGSAKIWDVNSGILKAKYNQYKLLMHAVEFDPSNTILAVGQSNGAIILWDYSSNHVIDTLVGHSSAVTDLHFSTDGTTLISMSSEGLLKKWNMKSKKEIYSRIQISRNEWLSTTPDGRFDGSSKSLKMVNYVSGLKVIPINSLFKKYYTPNLISTPNLVNQSNNLRGAIESDMIDSPELEFIIVGNNKKAFRPLSDSIYTSKNSLFSFDIGINSKEKVIDEIKFYNNGKLTKIEAIHKSIEFRGGSKDKRHIELKLNDGINKISAIAINASGVESNPIEVSISFNGEQAKTDLYLLSIGINEYKNPSYNLNFAKNDAKSLVQSIKKGADTLFNRIIDYNLSDKEATKTNIQQTIASIKKEIGPEDVFVFYYAGHGTMTQGEKAKFYIVTHDVTNLYGDEKMLNEKAISAEELLKISMELEAQKQLFVLDACHSGGALNTIATRGDGREKALAQLARSSGTYFLTASQDAQYANEAGDLKHGLFTYALLEILQGKTPQSLDRKITINEMKTYVEERVPELSQKYHGSAQYPTSYSFGQDFPIVILK